MSPLKAIRANCIECSGGVLSEVKNCVITDCFLYPFRMGKTGRKLEMTAARQAAFDKMRVANKKAQSNL